MHINAHRLILAVSLCVGIILSTFLITPPVAIAHILTSDSSGKTGAILHVTPNDDPSAGATSGIYYDVESGINLVRARVSLVISSDTGGIQETVPVSVQGNTVSAAFNFPVRGLYFLSLTITPNGPNQKIITITSSQRIVHSLKGANPSSIVPAWAKVGIIASIWVALLFLITAYKRRRQIVEQSK